MYDGFFLLGISLGIPVPGERVQKYPSVKPRTQKAVSKISEVYTNFGVLTETWLEVKIIHWY